MKEEGIEVARLGQKGVYCEVTGAAKVNGKIGGMNVKHIPEKIFDAKL